MWSPESVFSSLYRPIFNCAKCHHSNNFTQYSCEQTDKKTERGKFFSTRGGNNVQDCRVIYSQLSKKRVITDFNL